MGAAKRRGSREVRVALAIEKEDIRRQADRIRRAEQEKNRKSLSTTPSILLAMALAMGGPMPVGMIGRGKQTIAPILLSDLGKR